MGDLRLKANRSILTNEENHNFRQLWIARMVMGEQWIFNFVESMMPLKLRKEAENCLPKVTCFWQKMATGN